MNCPLCQTANPSASQRCRACGAPLKSRAGDAATAPDALSNGTLLAGTYAVESVLGQGGFGITYRCHDQMLDRRVAVKEFFPSGCRRSDAEVQASRGLSDADFREARAQFLAEARTLARCHHVGIVGVHAAFEANQTAYMVMELLHGQTLAQLLTARGGAMNEAEAVGVIERVGEALQFVHEQNLLHRDIKPDNIIVCDDGRVMLIDFGTARETIAGQVQGHTVVVTPGYAPLEQYAKQARRGPFTDIYSLAATLYHLLTGQMPPAASDRAMGVQLRPMREFKPQLSPGVAAAVEAALQMEIARRPQSVREFLELLDAPVEQAELESYFHPQLAKLPIDEDEDSGDSPAIERLTESLRTRQQMVYGALPSATPQPVKIAPPRAPTSASDSLPANHNRANGRIQVKVEDETNNAGWWWFWVVIAAIVFIGFVALQPARPTITPSAEWTQELRPSSADSPPLNPAPDSSSNDSAQQAARQAWDALPALAPASIEALPVSDNAATAPLGSSGEGGGIEFSLDGKRLAYIDSASVLRVLSLPNRKLVRSLRLDKNYVPVDVLFAPDNQTIAVRERSNSAQSQNAIRTEVWSVRSGKRLGAFDSKAATEYNLPFAVTNEGQLLSWDLSDTSENYNLSSWNPKTDKVMDTAVVTPRTASLGYGVTSPDGKRVVVGDTLGLLRWFDLKNGKQIASSPTLMSPAAYSAKFGKPYRGTGNYAPGVLGIDYAPNGAWLASRTQSEITVFDSNANKIGSLAIEASSLFFSMSPTGKWLAAVGSLPYSPKATLLWNVENGQKIRLETPYENMRDFGFSPDGKQLYGIFPDQGKLQFVTWNVDATPIAPAFGAPSETSFSYNESINEPSLPVAQNENSIAVANGNTVEIRRNNGTLAKTLALKSSNLKALELSSDGRFVAASGDGGALELWNLATQQSEFASLGDGTKNQSDSLRAFETGLHNLAFSPDGKYFAGAYKGGKSQTIELWSLQNSPRHLASLIQQDPVNALLFSPDGKALICGDMKGLVRWYDVKTRQLKSQIRIGEPTLDLAFGGRNLIVMGDSSAVKYDVPAGAKNPLKQAAKSPLWPSFSEGRDAFTATAISSDGQLLASSQSKGTVQLWNLENGAIVQRLSANPDQKAVSVYSLKFSEDGTQLTAVGQKFGARQMFVTTYRRIKAQ